MKEEDGKQAGFFERLYRSEYENIVRYVERRMKDKGEAEDIAQDTFLEAYRKRELLKTHPNVQGWLRLTARNKLLKWTEAQRKTRLLWREALSPIHQKPGSVQGVDACAAAELACTVRGILSEKELEVLKYYYIYDYTCAEMADRLGISSVCLKVRILRMKQKIRDRLGSDFDR